MVAVGAVSAELTDPGSGIMQGTMSPPAISSLGSRRQDAGPSFDGPFGPYPPYWPCDRSAQAYGPGFVYCKAFLLSWAMTAVVGAAIVWLRGYGLAAGLLAVPITSALFSAVVSVLLVRRLSAIQGAAAI